MGEPVLELREKPREKSLYNVELRERLREGSQERLEGLRENDKIHILISIAIFNNINTTYEYV